MWSDMVVARLLHFSTITIHALHSELNHHHFFFQSSSAFSAVLLSLSRFILSIVSITIIIAHHIYSAHWYIFSHLGIYKKWRKSSSALYQYMMLTDRRSHFPLLSLPYYIFFMSYIIRTERWDVRENRLSFRCSYIHISFRLLVCIHPERKKDFFLLRFSDFGGKWLNALG